MPLTLSFKTIYDPDGHDPALLLQGDWIIVQISDGQFTGCGEASHSRDDERCRQVAGRLFDVHVRSMALSMEAIAGLEDGPFSRASDFVEATAISGINQALYELLARRMGVPVWQMVAQPFQAVSGHGEVGAKAGTDTFFANTNGAKKESVPVFALPAYATINRALTTRTEDDYVRCVEQAIVQGFTAIKCAPFERVTRAGDQIEQSRYGLSILGMLRRRFPALSLRVDCHDRFHAEQFWPLLDELDALSLTWLEAPFPVGPDYARLKSLSRTPIAYGELYFGVEGFAALIANGWVDVIMPDVKHVGGFGPLVKVARAAAGKVAISPHNPSGPVSAVASLHAALLCDNVQSLEIPLILDARRAYYLPHLKDGRLHLPAGAGWGDALAQ